jgi:hypothetical protein
VQNETVWDYDQRFKDVMGRLTFHIPDEQHREWFIAGLLPHIHCPLTQQKVTSQPEALEIMMKLEASPVGDGRYGTGTVTVGLLRIQLSEIMKEKEKCEHVWCITCKTKAIERKNVQHSCSIWPQEHQTHWQEE